MTCIQEVTCELASTVCIGSSLRLVTSATLGEPELQGRTARDPEQYVPQHAGLTETVPVWKLEDWKTSQHGITVDQSHCLSCCLLHFTLMFFSVCCKFCDFSLRATIVLNLNPVGLKSDGTTGQTTGHLEVDMPRATVPSLSTCDGRTTGHWPVALFKRRDRR